MLTSYTPFTDSNCFLIVGRWSIVVCSLSRAIVTTSLKGFSKSPKISEKSSPESVMYSCAIDEAEV